MANMSPICGLAHSALFIFDGKIRNSNSRVLNCFGKTEVYDMANKHFLCSVETFLPLTFLYEWNYKPSLSTAAEYGLSLLFLCKV